MRRPGRTGVCLFAMALAAPLLLLATASIATSAAAAKNQPNAQDGVVYPLTSYLDWAQNPEQDLTNPALGENAFGQTIDNAEASVLQRYPDQLNLKALLGPNGPTVAAAFSEEMAAQLVHLRPRVANDDLTDQANPNYLPDFDHNGTYGDPQDYVAMEASDTSAGYFLYPCIADSGAVTYETTTGACAAAGTPGDTYKVGLAQRVPIIDSRGLQLQATVWLPAAALKAGCPTATPDPAPCTAPQGLAPRSAIDDGQGLPTVVIAEGIASSESDYFWLAMTLARAGDVVVTYDPAGQSESEGSVANLYEPSVPSCEFGGACRDLEDVVRWVVGDPIVPVVNLATANPDVPSTSASTAADPSPAVSPPAGSAISNPAYQPAGDNIVDPALAAVDPHKLAIVGHSMGALSVLSYLLFQGHGGTGVDGRPLPPVVTGIVLSGAAPTTATVPIQFQTSDYDGSPALVGPTAAGIDLGIPGNGIGYADMKPLYDQLRADGPGNADLSMIVLEGGVHTDFIDTPFIPRTAWSLAVSAHYASAWLGCFLDDNPTDCLVAVVPVPHLSSSFASEATPSGPLPRASDCITVPTTASLNDSPTALISAEGGDPVYNCIK
jgi:pimeloyl-ACP methyl ester carboxylesterase